MSEINKRAQIIMDDIKSLVSAMEALNKALTAEKDLFDRLKSYYGVDAEIANRKALLTEMKMQFYEASCGVPAKMGRR